MIQRAWLACAVTSLASVAAASSTTDANPDRSYVLDGEILVYPASVSGLPISARLAPQGARVGSEQLLTVSSITTASADMSRFESGALVHGVTPLLLGEGGGAPLTLGDLTLHMYEGRWTFFGSNGDLAGRPVFALTSESAVVERLSDLEFTIAGELELHESIAAELGIQPLELPGSIVVGATILHGAGYPGAVASAGAPAPKQALVPASSALTQVGPDVVVSTVGVSTGTNTLSEYGVVGTIHAYAVQTVSCNIGTQDAIWIRCTTGAATCNQHPVIGTQFYRLKSVNGATRFEQIGMSWLKHGFCAADAPNCGTPYTPNGSCDWLGLFATDTYSASLNASQTNCGPRSEVNPWTGVFPYPYGLNWNTSGNAIFKRVQIEAADLDPAQNSGAQYVGEVVYICTDEPDANRFNNYSNRAVVNNGLSGSQYNLEFSGATNWQQTAIERWAILDTGVTLVQVDVPFDGRVIVGAKVTNLGGNQWHYEYAVFNMNCDTAVQRVTVPVDASVVVTPGSIGFHDVPYHSGEPYSGTDWPSARNAGNVTWQTESFGVNTNANALRWSTLYNFRFDANIAPVTGNIELGLFKSGGNATASGLPVPGSYGVPFCFGDGTGTACPCANSGAAGNGCAHSLNPAGANLAGSGTPLVSSDTYVLTTTGMPNGPGLYFQGDAQGASGAGFPFGDGLLCASGAIIRMGVKFSAANSSSYPGVGDAPISVSGLVAPGNVRYYQQWFRDAGTFCTSQTFNLTNGVATTWGP